MTLWPKMRTRSVCSCLISDRECQPLDEHETYATTLSEGDKGFLRVLRVRF